jgi:predicted transcriptional regulator
MASINMKAMRTISLKVPDALDRELTAAARRDGVSKSAVMRQALARHVGAARGRRKGSLLSLAGDSVGRVVGPADLASNKRRLADYGR